MALSIERRYAQSDPEICISRKVQPEIIIFEHMTDADLEQEIPQNNEEVQTPFEEKSAEWLQPSEHIQHPTGIELINTRLWMSDLSEREGKPVTVGTVPEEEWKKLFEKYDSFWFMGIYKPSEFSRNHAKKYAFEYRYAIPDIDPEKDVVASPFAIPEYTPNPAIASDWEEWDQMVDKLHGNGKKVFIDFVPNHMGVDHPWVTDHPEYFIQGTEDQKKRNPSLYHTIRNEEGNELHLAHGKDPNYPEWSDTLQLNYARADVQEVMQEQLLDLVDHADGVRCDMAMLLNAETFIRTWGNSEEGNGKVGNHLTEEEKKYLREHNFWPKAIATAKEKALDQGKDDFYFVAEAYWDKEELGKDFDYIYGKDFYEHLVKLAHGDNRVSPVSLKNHLSYLMNALKEGRHYRDVLFTENHDEDRAVRVFGKEPSKAAAAITAMIPEGLFLLNQGQEDGRRIRPPMQIKRFPGEEQDASFQRFYDRLLTLKHSRLFQEGEWSLANITWNNPNIVAQQVEARDDSENDENESTRLEMGAVVCTNFGNQFASCRIPDVGPDMDVSVVSLSENREIKQIDNQRKDGMYVGLIPWESQVILYSPKKKIDEANSVSE